jgi:glycosyltransferase involved in cell wall biosynthesis
MSLSASTTIVPNAPLAASVNAETAPPLITQPVVLLIPYIMKHQEPQIREAAQLIPNMQVLMSVWLEPQRDYKPDHQALNTTVQRTWTFRKKWKHESGFEDNLQVHFPYDTLFQLRRLKPAVVVSYELGARSLFAAIYRLLHRRSRLVLAINVSEHTERSWSRRRVLMRKYLLKCADVVTYQGTSGQRYLQSLEVPSLKLQHVPYVAHPAMLHSGSTVRPPETRRRFIFVGQFTERKAPVAFLSVLSKWCSDHPNRPVEISMVGRGPLQSKIELMQHPSNLRVNMIGSVAPEKLGEQYALHGIMVFPTLADEWGLVVDEALHSGLPILSSIYAQGTLDLVVEGENGWQFTPDDEQNTYAAIDRVMAASDDDLNRMASIGRTSVAHRTPEFGGKCLVKAIQAALDS